MYFVIALTMCLSAMISLVAQGMEWPKKHKSDDLRFSPDLESNLSHYAFNTTG